ncbi:hypothetical protein SDRG_02100 [Saprolegnia diclina VS20]|uniref:Uncharacterized protein n=1 Tax=Saprolegnia diclina (strain VS20) TaxID=1156394 RepID=T0QSD5_SAPDV|nr:hypothetical protein SDRG_02100 [Saprolegnia diclina VS20]EQC41044.1 hypothetical protein SDRG_02100 [Saprolegnia diclina VS20]|eukprot:XP_008605888.1 hypothetical protein SDRG_02100 [Saprolegnia diclina VS20]
MTTLACYANTTACRKRDWAACGYGWLATAPVGVFWLVWLVYGLRCLQRHKATNSWFDVDKIHDPVAQGMAVALSQRRSASLRRSHLQRYMKFCAMSSEWLAFSYTPLVITFKVAGVSSDANVLFLLNVPSELINVVSTLVWGCLLLGLHVWKAWSRRRSPLILRFIHPLTFDVFYIPLISTLGRLGSCPEGFDHIVLPGGATCECVDRMGLFWALGLSGFVILYASALYFKMHVEPLARTTVFRFQTNFQIIMVMARTLNPIMSMLVSDLDAVAHPVIALALTLGFFFCVAFLLYYVYTTQPCIGSGRLPNNIRAVTFSSSCYTSLCALGFLLADKSITSLYYSLAPLPLVWVLAWHLNERRARLFHVPNLPIWDLLLERSVRSKTVGTIAALYVDAINLPASSFEGIIAQLEKIVKRSAPDELPCRAYALRALWFCHVKGFCLQKGTVGQQDDSAMVPFKLWYKDREAGASSHTLLQKQTKVHRITQLEDVAPHTTMMWTPPLEPRAGWRRVVFFLLDVSAQSLQSRTRTRTRMSIQMLSAATNYALVRLREKHWIVKVETSDAAVFSCTTLYNSALEVLAQSCAMGDVTAMQSTAVFLLQWYKAKYLRLSKLVYLHVLTTIVATSDARLVTHAALTLYRLVLDNVLPLDLWRQNTTHLNFFISALGHAAASTVLRCATVLNLVFQAAADDPRTNLFLLVTPASRATIHAALHRWHHVYDVSVLLEDLCIRLYNLEVAHQTKRKPSPIKRSRKTSFNNVLQWFGARKRSITNAMVDQAAVIVRSAESRMSRRSIARERGGESRLRIESRRLSAPLNNLMGLRPLVAHRSVKQSVGYFLSHVSSNGRRDNATCSPSSTKVAPAIVVAPKPPPPARCPSLRAVNFATIDATARTVVRLDRLTFVTPAIVAEINRRRGMRKQLLDLLRSAQSLQSEPNANSNNAVAPQARTRNLLDEALTKAGHLASSAPECAIADYVAHGLPPELLAFFDTHVAPRLLHATTPATAKTHVFTWLFAYAKQLVGLRRG